MSRYEIQGREPHHLIAVGWDPPLQTYFLQVFDNRIKDEDRRCTVWIGAAPGEHIRAEELFNAVKPYATLSQQMILQLLADRAKDLRAPD